jgi:signal transduction histidine kinase
MVLNEALHELRRPLQALVLAGTEGAAAPAGIEHSVRMAATALARLDREINGGPTARAREPLSAASLLAASVERWQGSAAAAGGTLVLRGQEGEGEPGVTAPIVGDRWALAQALDNLVVNAIEHGGPRIVVSVSEDGGRLRVSVRDCGRPLPLPGSVRAGRRVALRDRLRGRTRHGHGLRVVRRIAAEHGGRFALHRTAGGAEAVLELPAA